MDNFPPLDHTLAPYTGWTRAHWVALLARMTAGYARAAQRGGSPARALYPDDRRGLPDAVDAIESFARIASAWGAWLQQPANPDTLEFEGQRLDVAALLRQALLDGTDRTNSHTYWGAPTHMDQRLVESADMAVAVYLSRERVFDRLTSAQQTQIMDWLALVDGQGTYYDNWVLFPALAQTVRLKLGRPVPMAELDANLDQADAFYRGDGWYVDGPSDEYELYNAWMFNWHFLHWAAIDGDRRPELCQAVLERSRSFLAGFPYFFGANGSYAAFGRSLVYRFAALAGFGVGHQLGVAPDNPGLLRRASSGCLRYFYEHGLFEPGEHYVRQGFHGDFPPAGEAYISPGSPYWCCHGLYALAFDPQDPFWTAPEAPLPVEQNDFELTLPVPGFVLAGRQVTGQVLLLNSRSGQELDAPGHNYTSKYGKFTYSTHFPFNVLPVRGSWAPDAMISLTRDGRTFGHRGHTRAGGAAPGFTWCCFDQVLSNEPQMLWVAVLLAGDRQLRVAYIRSTFPVQAYEAPGALGCDGPAGIKRRSDATAGWEYAEVDGSALGIRRLLGYDGQQPSLPFLGSSNINLAYTYAEQPTVHEREPSVAPRCLAAVSLVRPNGFDPSQEFDGFNVTAEPTATVRATLPDGTAACVVLGDVLPATITVAGCMVRGRAVRYARIKPDRSEISGLGLTSVDGVAMASAPATLRLALQAEGEASLTTDAGLTLDGGWLGGTMRQASVQALDGNWTDVSERCQGNTLPPELVREWSRRNQRTLVHFKVRR